MQWEHFRMAINLLDLAYNLSSEEYAKIILSSGDYFPGFYRFTMGTRTYEAGQMTVRGLIKCYLEFQVTGHTRHRDEWFETAIKRLNSLDTRLQSRSDYAVYDLLNARYRDWVENGMEYDIAVIEINNKKELTLDQTYFFMGSMIRFTNDSILLGYDDHRQTAIETININFEKSKQIVDAIYPTDFAQLFLPSRVVGNITFDNDGEGSLFMKDTNLEYLCACDSNSVIVASNRSASQNLSMRWAKDICLTEYE